MSIHNSHPFLPAAECRDIARRFRGRLASPVTLWLAGTGAQRVGLTVSSVMIGLGDQPVVMGLLDPDSELAQSDPETLTVSILTTADRQTADVFGGVAPAPGGAFRQRDFLDTPWGPRLAAERSWVGARVIDKRRLGWSLEVLAALESVQLAEEDPVTHVRGRYRGLSGDR